MQKKQQNQKQKIAASKGCRITWQPTSWARLEVGDHQLFAIRTTWNTKQIRKSIGNILYCKYYIICYTSYPFIEPVLSNYPWSHFSWDSFSGIWRAAVIKISLILFRKTDDGSGSTTRFTITLEKADACLPLILQNQEDFWRTKNIHKNGYYPQNANSTIATHIRQANENPSVSFPNPADFKFLLFHNC